MTYPKVFSEIQQTYLREIVPQAEALAEGEGILIRAATPAAAAELRYLVYAWLSPEHTNRKAEFRIRRSGTPSAFILERRETISQISVKKVEAHEAQPEHPLLEQIVGCPDEDSAEEAVCAFGLSPEEALRLMNDWRKIHNG